MVDVTRQCACCGDPITGRNDTAVYCSSRCKETAKARRKRGHQPRVPQQPRPGCAVCGKPVLCKDSSAKYCTIQCAGIAKRKPKALPAPRAPRPGPSTAIRYCKHCTRPFPVAQRRSYCSERCYFLSRGFTPPGETATYSCRGGCGQTHTMAPSQGGWTCDPCMAATQERRRASPRFKQAKADENARRRARKRVTRVDRFSRAEVFERDRWVCQLCGKRTQPRKRAPHPLSPALDHVVPLAHGGAHTKANTQCAHFLCNSIKGDRAVPAGEQLRLIG